MNVHDEQRLKVMLGCERIPHNVFELHGSMVRFRDRGGAGETTLEMLALICALADDTRRVEQPTPIEIPEDKGGVDWSLIEPGTEVTVVGEIYPGDWKFTGAPQIDTGVIRIKSLDGPEEYWDCPAAFASVAKIEKPKAEVTPPLKTQAPENPAPKIEKRRPGRPKKDDNGDAPKKPPRQLLDFEPDPMNVPVSWVTVERGTEIAIQGTDGKDWAYGVFGTEMSNGQLRCTYKGRDRGGPFPPERVVLLSPVEA